MLEKIILSISTAIFFVCTFIVNSIFPPQTADAASVNETEAAVMASANAAVSPLTGKWMCTEKIIEFTEGGKIVCDGISADYKLDGQLLTVNLSIGGNDHEYKTEVEFIDPRNIRLGSVTLRKVQ